MILFGLTDAFTTGGRSGPKDQISQMPQFFVSLTFSLPIKLLKTARRRGNMHNKIKLP